MPRRIALAFLLLAVGVIIGVTLRPNLAAEPPKEEKKEKPITLDELSRRGVEGQLGQTLGTVVTIEGEVVDGSYTGKKAHSSETLLRVTSVNGSELKTEPVFVFSDDGKPKVGTKFKYRGFESGGYGGIVPELSRTQAGVGYGFQTYFHILKDELKQEKKK
jgi:hypothetical protein